MPRAGVDSFVDASQILSAVTTAAGQQPSFWMRYIAGAGATSRQEIAQLHAQGIAVGLLSNAATGARVQGTRAEGAADAARDIAAAQALGAPANVRLGIDLEASWSPSAEYLLGWCEAQVAGPYAGAGLIYCNPLAPGTAGALAALVAAWPDTGNLPVLWSAEPEPGPGPIPTWAPATHPDLTAMLWQYAENAYGGLVDLDLAADSYPGLWEAPAVGYTDVPADAWYAPVVAQATAAGLMDGVGGGKFDPNGTVTRAQLAAVAIRTLTAARSPVPPAVPAVGGVPRSNPWARLRHPEEWVGLSQTTSAQRAALLAQLPVRHPWQVADCVAEVAAELRQLWDLYLQMAGAPGKYASAYIYGKGHLMNGVTSDVGGLQPVWAWEVLQRFGVCPVAADPIGSATETVQQAIAALTPAMDAAAAGHRITAYGPIPLGGEGTIGANFSALATAIDHFPVALTVPVPATAGLFQPLPGPDGRFVAHFPTGASVSGYHELLAWDYRSSVLGYPENQIRIRNSWGPGWADGGDCWLSADYPLVEAWSISCALPAPTPPAS